MPKEDFEKIDASLTEDLKHLRKKQVPSAILKGFSVAVEARLRAKGYGREKRVESARRSFVPMWVPVCAVFVIALFLVSKPIFHLSSLQKAASPIQIASVHPEDIAEEIDTLRELGIWTEEDEKGISLSDESALWDLEFSDANVRSKAQLA